MKQGPFYKNRLLQFLSAAALVPAALFLYRAYLSAAAHFNIVILLMLARHASLSAAILLILSRIFRLTKRNSGYAYPVTSFINVSIGAFCLVFYLSGRANLWWLNQCMLNWLLGLVMAADIFYPGANEVS